MNGARAFHTATLLDNGSLLVGGGAEDLCAGDGVDLLASLTGSWTALASRNVARHKQIATLLDDGTVLVIGGEDHLFNALPSTEVFQTEVAQPRIDITLSKSTYVTGDRITASHLRVQTPSGSPVKVRIEIWLDVPGMGKVSLIDAGSDGSVSFPTDIDVDAGPLSLIEVTAAFPPRGTWGFNSRLTNPTTGAVLSEDLNTFVVQ